MKFFNTLVLLFALLGAYSTKSFRKRAFPKIVSDQPDRGEQTIPDQTQDFVEEHVSEPIADLDQKDAQIADP
ncbi:MAG: hypothetical protein MHPSP_004370 [Paramarteilia canceri]